MTSKLQKNILIVDDEKPLAHALELKLKHEGHSTFIASNGQECIDMLKKNTVDLILLDLIMPNMDGFQVLQALKNLNSNIPVFVLSNLSQPEDKTKALGLGAKKYFIKSNTPLSVIVDEIKQL